MESLAAYGWNSYFANQLGASEEVPARVVSQQRGRCLAVTEAGELPVELSGKLRFSALGPGELPAVGDWLAVRLSPDGGLGIVVAVLERKSVIARGRAGKTSSEQVLAANVDTAFVVTTVDRDFNPRRLERYLAMIWAGGARPVILINKIELCPDRVGLLASVESAFPGVEVLGLSALSGQGVDSLGGFLVPGQTAVMLGSSGVGKSTLLNRLMGNGVQKLGAVRESDKRGRHTTTSRQMFMLPGGGLLIDTPGLRELKLSDAGSGIERAFVDISTLAGECRFRDCRHLDELGCAVLAALTDGRLSQPHYDNYVKLLKEQEYQRRREDPVEDAKNKRRWKSIMKDLPLIQRLKRGEEG
ncbi:MAG: ribosome small subunit-dependent GTPase A [Elusimicrobia bacterium GWA2_69_24]|nr:MAG: ribosome small subunit-dependent GTPase A [Elusimicrobia bacterium GWA2_69_24]HBL18614.1 ribosome small subunit-dependent GTPase A [Elusimicrobiota bacterium]